MQVKTHPLNVTVLTVLVLAGFIGIASILLALVSSSSLYSSTHPVVIPWIGEQHRCETSGRTWREESEEECLDYEHSAEF
ncbi:hypothetical protein H6F78_12025 [Coleofasciculus sp. FACHB-64]|jgi:hypothetical protein|uniref:hypothetical protein n=1 Tax=Cyanophyceae TaxID=3028117 RepID=UPI00168738B6|nr:MULTISPECIES: hypothetical protein [unclassified Coleofasciculus]MBD1841373.1 hypothetical protein [Coleofasciculus sp. FACHB-501]MBD1877649.1 hypothetical protein [Coleofasciculus sp. FACHB-T130]MBD1888194.1 hypothetical protein [Coleofasciculus sp. FACHB-SPT9]MBD1899576.1 hypothetical protein [Coleofasciculus sp. FACHB-125]MBD1941586.1 hypothetical protein [Coleofasciculus sp. FACHB-712]